MRIDFISDVACPWCAVGLSSLELALTQVAEHSGAPVIDLHFQPFELNPHLGPDGQDAAEYLKAKYGMSDADLARSRAHLRERGQAVGFTFGHRAHVWNTFDAHRLLHWAGLQDDAARAHRPTNGAPNGATGGTQRALKQALLAAYHRDGLNPAAPDVLLSAATSARLDAVQAQAVIESHQYHDDVRAAQDRWQRAGIRAVPSVVIDGQHLIQGGQPPEVFAKTILELAAEAASATGPR